MPPKRAKSQQGSAVGQKWEQAILSTPFHEEKWNASVALVIGKQAEDAANISVLNECVASGIRKLFSIISKEELYATVKDLGNTKAPKKAKEIPQYSEICEPCKTYLDNNEEIPLPLLARLLKYRLLHIKTTDIKRRETEKKVAADGSKSAATKGGKADKKGERAKSAGKGKGGKKTPEPPSAKNESKLRKRGEEDEEGKYIDDEPDDGPQHYVIITGFHHPHLFAQLAEIGVNVESYIQMSSEDYSRFKPNTSNIEEKDEKTLALEAELAREKELEQQSLEIFWRDVLLVLRNAPANSHLHDIARLAYTVPQHYVPPVIEDAEQKAEFGKALFEDVACMMYDLLDRKRQWQNFLKNLKLLHVPVFGESSASANPQDAQSLAAPPLTPSTKKGQAVPDESRTDGEKSVLETERLPTEVDMRYYNDMMNCVPYESASVPLILHCMLEQVLATEENLEPPSETPRPRRQDGLDDTLAKHISHMAYKLALTQEEQALLAEEFERPVPKDSGPKQPVLLNYHDELTSRLRHLETVENFNPMKAELEMMGFLPVAGLSEFRQPSPKVFVERAARLQELIHFVSSSSLTQPEIDRAFKQFVFESMNWSKADEDGRLCHVTGTQRDIPWDDPYPYFIGMVPTHDEEHEVSPEEEKMPSEAAELSVHDTSFFSDDDALQLGAEASNVSDSSGSPRHRKTKKTSATPHPQGQDAGEESDNSRPATPKSPGILKRSDSAQSRKSNSSVRFDGDAPVEPEPEMRPLCVSDEEWSYVNDKQQRQLDQWCFAEHMEPHVLLQVLANAQYQYDCLDTYYHKRDHTLMVVLHNPSNRQLFNYSDWRTELHSNVGFRNYLEHIAGGIEEWTATEEAKYEAMLLQQEVEHIHKEAEETASRAASEKGDKKGAKGKEKKGAKSPRSQSRASSEERESDNPFVRANSLKAYKEELDKLKAEEEEKEREKELKRIRSAEKKKAKEDEKKDDKKKRPGSRGSAKSKQSKEEPTAETQGPDAPVKQEEFWPFHGYDLANNLLHVQGQVTTALPADGGIIRTEKTSYTQGSSSVKCTVLKDGHTFQVHVLDPLCERLHPASNPEEEGVKPCVGSYGSISGIFKDGMAMSLSIYGENGEPLNGGKYQPAAYEPPAAPTPVPANDGKGSPGKAKKEKGKSVTPEPQQEVEEVSVVAEEPIPQIHQPYNQLSVTCPDGLHVKFMLQSALGINPENEDDRNIVVKQCYPFKTRGVQSCESTRHQAMQEISRVINTDGTVIKTMPDGVVQVLYGDGRVTEFVQNSPLLPTGNRGMSPHRPGSASKSPERETPSPTKKASRGSRRSAKKKTDEGEQVEQEPVPTGFWITTQPNGARIATKLDATKVPVKDALLSIATDPATSQSMQTREDHVVCVKHPDGTTVVEHADGTRITSFWRRITVPSSNPDDQQETGESAPTETKDVKVVVVECQGFATVKLDQSSILQCSTEFGSGTVIHCSTNGSYDVYHNDGGYLQIYVDGSAQYFPHPDNELEVYNPNQQLQYSFRHFADVLVETVDNEGNVFNVKSDGSTIVMKANNEVQDSYNITCYKQHAPRLFVIHPDGRGTELLRYQDISEYMMNAEDDPNTAILMDALPDCPGILGITVLKPFNKALSDYWIKPYLQQSIVPPGLVSRDLSSLPAFEEKKEGPTFGTNVGTGLAVGSAIKSSSIQPIVRCPTLLQVRQILQYKPVSTELRDQLWTGLFNYGEFVKRKLELMDGLLIDEPRSPKEQSTAKKLQELSLQRQNSMPVQAALKPIDDVKHIYEKALAPPIPSPPPTPQPKRTKADWERDQRELALEQENKRKLRNHEVPPYFKSELGKAFLLTQAPDIENMKKELKDDGRRDASRAIRSNTSSPGSTQRGVGTGNTPSLRPGNPTPGHAQGTGSPAAVRPSNPTPAHAHKTVPDRPGAPTADLTSPNSNGFADIPEEREDSQPRSGQKRSPLTTSVTGTTRNSRVQVPGYLSMSKPQASTNARYAMVEDPVRRKVCNSSVAGATPQGAEILARMRGFQLLPDTVNFGLLREGNTYSFIVALKNTGIDSCRFRIKQPPPSTGMKVFYKPGPVAAGMKGEINIEIYAIAVGVEGGRGVGQIQHSLEIITETDQLLLPIKASVMTAYEYDKQQEMRLSPGVEQLNNKPPPAGISRLNKLTA